MRQRNASRYPANTSAPKTMEWIRKIVPAFHLICLVLPAIAFSQSKVRSGQKVAESIMFNLEHGKYPPDVYFDSKVQFEYKNKIFVVKFVLKSEEGVDFNYITRTLVHQEREMAEFLITEECKKYKIKKNKAEFSWFIDSLYNSKAITYSNGNYSIDSLMLATRF